MASWVSHPSCVEIDVEVEETFKMPDPLWPGLGFAIAFVVGGIIGAVIAKFCLRDYLKKRVSTLKIIDNLSERILSRQILSCHLTRSILILFPLALLYHIRHQYSYSFMAIKIQSLTRFHVMRYETGTWTKSV